MKGDNAERTGFGTLFLGHAFNKCMTVMLLHGELPIMQDGELSKLQSTLFRVHD